MERYKNKSISQLIKIIEKKFNASIRKRDEGKPCINCGQYRTLQAGHYFPTSTYSGLRFHKDNVHGECKQCNYFDSQSHAFGYRNNLIQRIGEERFRDLENQAAYLKRHRHYWNRFELIELLKSL